MARRYYRNPPVHEVIFDLRFSERLSEQVVERLPDFLPEGFPSRERIKAVTLTAQLGTTGSAIQAEPMLAGWEFSEVTPRMVVRANPNGLALHVARPGEWPSGEYPGWEAIFDRFVKVHSALTAAYGGLPLARAGLRYLNRIAIPRGAPISEFFNIGLAAPDTLEDIFSFNLAQTWGTVRDAPGLSATIRFATIQILDPSVASGHLGVIMEVEIFNLRVDAVPTFAGSPAWFEGAHTAEGRVFEASITDKLRATFEEVTA